MDPSHNIDTEPWKKTFKKQQRLLRRREQHAKQATSNDDLEFPPAGPTSGVGYDFRPGLDPASPQFEQRAKQDSSNDDPGFLTGYDPEPRLRPASPQISAVVAFMKTTAPQFPYLTVSDDSDVDEVSAPAAGPSSEDKNDVLISAMASLVVSSPSKTILPLSTPKKHKNQKYYVVSVGKRTGVFDSWPCVHSLTSGVSGSCQKSYATYQEALDVYRELKASGLLRIVRDRGDDDVFGPVEDAIE